MYLTKDIHTRSIELGIPESGRNKLMNSSKKFSAFIDSTEKKLNLQKDELNEEREQDIYDREI